MERQQKLTESSINITIDTNCTDRMQKAFFARHLLFFSLLCRTLEVAYQQALCLSGKAIPLFVM